MPLFESADRYNDIVVLRSGLTIYPSQDKAIDAILTEMLKNIPARFVLLCDVSGQVISARGDRAGVEPVALASLVAGDLAASQEIARLLGEYQAYQITLREGKSAHTFIAEAGAHMAMLVQVDADVPLGWARMLILKNAKKLAEIISTPPEELQPESKTATITEAESLMHQEENLTEMFGHALDELWND